MRILAEQLAQLMQKDFKYIEIQTPYVPSLQETSKYVGDSSTHEYHKLSCKIIGHMKPRDMVWFGSAAEAKEFEYRRCNECKG